MTTIELHLVEHRKMFLNYVRKRISDPYLAEDILHDCFLKAIQYSPHIEDGARLIGWFYRVLQNQIIDTYRRRAAELNRKVRYANEVEPAVNIEEQETTSEWVIHLAETLKPEYAEALKAVYLDGEDMEEASKRLQISPTNLRVRLHRARQALLERMKKSTGMEHRRIPNKRKSSAARGVTA